MCAIQVPVLKISTSADGKTTFLTESLTITNFLGDFNQDLLPADRANDIKQLLNELHDINYFSLTYTHKPQRASDMERAVHNVLADPRISSRHREALYYKLDV